MIPCDVISRIEIGDLVKFARHIEVNFPEPPIGVALRKDKERSTTSLNRWYVRWFHGDTYSYDINNLRKVKDDVQAKQ